jgi:ribonuclease D
MRSRSIFGRGISGPEAICRIFLYHEGLLFIMLGDGVPVTYVDTQAGLEKLCADLAGSPWLALDTEFIREKTYYSQLCLLQIANHSTIACVDTIALKSIDPLLDLIYDSSIEKVMHAAFQDMEIFYDLRGSVRAPLFDTQIAATVLGQGYQLGYAGLVFALLGNTLDKSMTRTDWSQRPLSPEQITYAADDVRYLRQVYLLQKKELLERRRLDWLAEDFAEITNPATYSNPPEEAWQRLRGAEKLTGLQLSVLRGVAAWREVKARQENRPRKWILSDDVLMDLARIMPTNAQKMSRIRGIEPGQMRRIGDELMAVISESAAKPPETFPVADPRVYLTPEQDVLADILTAVIRVRAMENSISPQAFAGRKDIERLVAGDKTVPLLHGWRKGLVGHDVQAVLNGELVVKVKDGRPEIVKSVE